MSRDLVQSREHSTAWPPHSLIPLPLLTIAEAKLFLHALVSQNELVALWRSGVGIFLLDALVVNYVGRVIRVDCRYHQFHFCFNESS